MSGQARQGGDALQRDLVAAGHGLDTATGLAVEGGHGPFQEVAVTQQEDILGA